MTTNQSHLFYQEPSLLEQKFLHKALTFKFGTNAKALDMVLSDPSNEEGVSGKFKNVCALLSKPLVDRLENTLGLLDMSKREFFEIAIIEALDKADAVMSEVDILEYERAIAEHEAKGGE